MPNPTRNPISLPENPELRPCTWMGKDARYFYLRAVGKDQGLVRPAVEFPANSYPFTQVQVRVSTSAVEFRTSDGSGPFSGAGLSWQAREVRGFFGTFGFGGSRGFLRPVADPRGSNYAPTYVFDQWLNPAGWFLNATVCLITEQASLLQHLVAIAEHVPGVTDVPTTGTTGGTVAPPPMAWAQARALAKAGRYVRRRAWPAKKVLTYWAGAGTAPAVAMVFEETYATGASGLVTTTVRRVVRNSDFGRLEFEVADWEAGQAPA